MILFGERFEGLVQGDLAVPFVSLAMVLLTLGGMALDKTKHT